jgi:osmoprotectant transport system permease protein
VFGAFVGGGGLGGVITQAIRISDMGMIALATGVLMVIAVVLDLIMSWFEGQMRKSRGGSKIMWIPVAAILLAFCLLLPYGRGSRRLHAYDGDYAETQLMHHMVTMLVEEPDRLTSPSGPDVQGEKRDALKDDGHTCDLISPTKEAPDHFFLQDTPDVAGGHDHLRLREGKARRGTMTSMYWASWALRTPTPSLARDPGGGVRLETISDLIPIADQLTFGAEQEFFTLEAA